MENNVASIPYDDFLVFGGFCLIAAISARGFLDTISRQLLRDVRRLDDRTSLAVQQAREAKVSAGTAAEEAEATADLVENRILPATEPSELNSTNTAELLAPDTPIPGISANERKVLSALMQTTFRTATGISRDAGIPRNQIGEILDTLAKKRLVERTVSPNTGGPRWRITRLGAHALNPNQSVAD